MYYAMFGQMKKTLGQVDKWMDAATTFAKERSFDPKVFLDLRLAPDQFAFARQIRLATDTAKSAATRLDELQAGVRAVIAFLDTLTPADFDGAATRVVTQPRWEGKVMTGADYFLEHAVPNFFFHTSHAYAILRHGGVNLGKRDFLGTLTQRLP